MAYDPYKLWDVNRYRSDALGGPRLYVRCGAMSMGDQCEYRIHAGHAHAAKSGSHRWIELPLGFCSMCADPVFPLDAKSRRVDGQHVIVPMCCDDATLDEVPGGDDDIEVLPGPDPFGSTSEWASR